MERKTTSKQEEFKRNENVIINRRVGGKCEPSVHLAPMTFFTSDLHLGHRNIIRLCGRPFASLEEMDETLVRRWNRKVGQDDNVFVVGDLFFRAENPEGLLKRLNGRKTLILGNHDRSWTDTVDLARYFKGVHTMLETSDGVHSLTLCHYPMMTFNHCMRGYMVHGHIHGNTDADYFPYLATHERILNASVEVNNYEPVTFDELVVNNRRHKEHYLRLKERNVKGNDK